MELPDKKFYSKVELAHRWNISLVHLNQYVDDLGLLRMAFKLEDVAIAISPSQTNDIALHVEYRDLRHHYYEDDWVYFPKRESADKEFERVMITAELRNDQPTLLLVPSNSGITLNHNGGPSIGTGKSLPLMQSLEGDWAYLQAQTFESPSTYTRNLMIHDSIPLWVTIEEIRRFENLPKTSGQSENIFADGFSKNGLTWELRFSNRSYYLPDNVNLATLHKIMIQPNKPIMPLELAEAAEFGQLTHDPFQGKEDTPDHQAILDYTKRNEEITDRLREIEELIDEPDSIESFELLESERERLQDTFKTLENEIKRSSQFAFNQKRLRPQDGSAAKNATNTVRKRINRAIEQIEKECREAADYLDLHVTRGIKNVYLPSDSKPWQTE